MPLIDVMTGQSTTPEGNRQFNVTWYSPEPGIAPAGIYTAGKNHRITGVQSLQQGASIPAISRYKKEMGYLRQAVYDVPEGSLFLVSGSLLSRSVGRGARRTGVFCRIRETAAVWRIEMGMGGEPRDPEAHFVAPFDICDENEAREHLNKNALVGLLHEVDARGLFRFRKIRPERIQSERVSRRNIRVSENEQRQVVRKRKRRAVEL